MSENNKKENQAWQEKYCNEKIVELDKILNPQDIETLKKLNIIIEKGKVYTERELDEIYMELARFDDDMTGLYGEESPEEIKKQFERILTDECHTEREKTLLNMYYIECARNIKQEKSEEDKLENTEVSEEEYNKLMTKFDEIAQKYML